MSMKRERRFFVTLDGADFERLLERARAERRGVKEQAEWLLMQALRPPTITARWTDSLTATEAMAAAVQSISIGESD